MPLTLHQCTELQSTKCTSTKLLVQDHTAKIYKLYCHCQKCIGNRTEIVHVPKKTGNCSNIKCHAFNVYIANAEVMACYSKGLLF